MMRKRTLWTVMSLALCHLLLAGCGYRAGFLIPTDVKSIAIEVASNETTWREAVKKDNLPAAMQQATVAPAYTMEVELTETLKNEIVRRTPLRIRNRNRAASVLRVTITDVRQRVQLRDAADNVSSARMDIRVDFEWVDLRTGRVIASGQGVARPTDYVIGRGENVTTATRESFEYIAERIIERMQEGF